MTGPSLQHEAAERLLRQLDEVSARLILTDGEAILYRSDARGIRPLLEAVDHSQAKRFRGAQAADTTVGKAAALVFAYLGVGFVAARMLSRSGEEILRRYGIPSVGRALVPVIEGRVPGQPCPFEASVSSIDDPATAVDALRRTAERLFSLAGEGA